MQYKDIVMLKRSYFKERNNAINLMTGDLLKLPEVQDRLRRIALQRLNRTSPLPSKMSVADDIKRHQDLYLAGVRSGKYRPQMDNHLKPGFFTRLTMGFMNHK